MTDRELMQLAREANKSGHIDVNWLVHYHWDYLERFAALVAAAEREACAQVCEGMPRKGCWITKEEAAAAIRARGQA